MKCWRQYLRKKKSNMATLQVLISTMHQTECEPLLKKMNISSDAVVINQSDNFSYKEIVFNGNTTVFYTCNKRGLSNSRNDAIMNSNADIICIADDDMKYTDTYKDDILSEFEKHPEADAIIFYVESINSKRKTTTIQGFSRLRGFDYRNFSSVNIAIRREKLQAANVWFNTLFGTGSIYSCGEDTMFLFDLLKKNFHIYKSGIKIADVDLQNSTWFKGYNKEFFFNKGALVAAIYPRLWPFAIFFLSIKNSKKRLANFSFFRKLYSWYKVGALDYLKRLHGV